MGKRFYRQRAKVAKEWQGWTSGPSGERDANEPPKPKDRSEEAATYSRREKAHPPFPISNLESPMYLRHFVPFLMDESAKAATDLNP